ncbi:dipeptidyl peptidase III [Metarhizium acridum CQMa 102]|uniref:Dipeptidyl peptidase III n=1 Tax=Metarhizium acridum (strain CQMa 102) TaxID=655827 RepID=E9E2S9_METAQ|nr:dipeptidyl peptidase III [Metarhizium acridum CQMa 102]EFY89745.1 dipeptidyl peptidase III [Metarhizium acridum CQMa 102]
MASKPKELSGPSFEAMVRLETGHHAAGMSKICFHLDEAAKYVSNARQADILAEYIECFSTGSLEAYRNPQKSWVADIFPRVETILGFVEPYGDPYGVRAEWEGVVCIPDPDETYKLKALVEKSTIYNDTTPITADDLIYYTYLHIGVEGMPALRTFNVRDNIWGQPHARFEPRFAILKHSLLDGGGVLAVSHDAQAETVHVSVDRSKISSHGKPSLGRMLCCIQIWRCIADVESCRSFYQPLSAADGAHKTWRHIVAS